MIRFTITTLILGATVAAAIGQTISIHKHIKKVHADMAVIDKAAAAAA
jgi:hypothetical protein